MKELILFEGVCVDLHEPDATIFTQRRIQNTVKHLRWSFVAKIDNV